MKRMFPRTAATTLALLAASGGAMAQSFPPVEKYGMGRVLPGPAVTTPIAYSPWTRRCDVAGGSMCLTTKSAKLTGQFDIAVMLFEQKGRGGKVLLVRLPPDYRRSAGARMAIDDDVPLSSDHTTCGARECAANFKVNAAFIAGLKTGQHLQVHGVDRFGQWTSYRFPLDDFAAAIERRPPR
jgi:invasion protein IalB